MASTAAVSFQGKLGIDYSSAAEFLIKIQLGIDGATKEKAAMSSALSTARGAASSVQSAIDELTSVLEKMQNFKISVQNYKSELEDYDLYFSKKFISESSAAEGLGFIDPTLTAIDGVSVAGSTTDLINALIARGVRFTQKGKYIIIYGSPSTIDAFDLINAIKGTRYRAGSDLYYSSGLGLWHTPVGAGFEHFSKNLKFLVGKNLGEAVGKIYGFSSKNNWEKLGTAVAYVGVAVNVGEGVAENIGLNETDPDQYVGDAVVDAGFGLGGMAAAATGANIGMALGTVLFPGVGTAVGAAIGAGLGFLGGWVASELYEGVTETWEIEGRSLSDGAKWLIEGASDRGEIDDW